MFCPEPVGGGGGGSDPGSGSGSGTGSGSATNGSVCVAIVEPDCGSVCVDITAGAGADAGIIVSFSRIFPATLFGRSS